LAIEPLFAAWLLDPVFQGGSSIYRLTPCSSSVAYHRRPTDAWELPAAIRAAMPPALLPAPSQVEASYEDAADEPLPF